MPMPHEPPGSRTDGARPATSWGVGGFAAGVAGVLLCWHLLQSPPVEAPSPAGPVADGVTDEERADVPPEVDPVETRTGSEPVATESVADVAAPSEETVSGEPSDVFTDLAAAPRMSLDVEPFASVVRWSPVWRPFQSERTASGFATYIGEATGLELRVGEPDDAGRYDVEIGHRTEAERLAAVERIVRETGYRPPELGGK